MLRKRLLNVLLAIALILSLGVFGTAQTAAAAEVGTEGDNVEQQTPMFSDVASDHPAKTEIEYCAKNEFVFGYGGGIFNPDGDITREQFVTVWARTFHARMHNFNDATKTKNEIDNAIVLMYGLGYINGVSPTEFSRYNKITREQVAQIVKNTYLQGVDGHEMYKEFSDGTTVSDWARDAVSVVSEKGIFSGVIKDNKFEPQKPITRAEVCEVIYNLMEVQSVKYTITVNSTPGGTVTASKSTAAAGESVKLIIEAATGKRLKTDSLTMNGTKVTGTSFVMPAQNVTIDAEFEDIPTLESISVKTPGKLLYTVGDPLKTGALVITAHYTGGVTNDIPSGFTTSPAAGTILTEAGTKTVTITYKEGDVEVTTSYDVTVSEPS